MLTLLQRREADFGYTAISVILFFNTKNTELCHVHRGITNTSPLSVERNVALFSKEVSKLTSEKSCYASSVYYPSQIGGATSVATLTEELQNYSKDTRRTSL